MEIAIVVVQQKTLDWNALRGHAGQMNFEPLFLVKQKDPMIVSNLEDVTLRDWTETLQRKASIRRAFLFVFIEELPALQVELDSSDDSDVVNRQ